MIKSSQCLRKLRSGLKHKVVYMLYCVLFINHACTLTVCVAVWVERWEGGGGGEGEKCILFSHGLSVCLSVHACATFLPLRVVGRIL